MIVERPGQGLGFASAGYAIAVIDDPDASPDTWNPSFVEAPPSAFDAVPATAVVQDGAYIVAVAIRQEGAHAGALVRYATAQLAQGNVSHAEWWAGEERGWVPESSLGTDGPAFVLDDAGSECSLHWDDRRDSFIHIASYGFGTSTIGLRTAPICHTNLPVVPSERAGWHWVLGSKSSASRRCVDTSKRAQPNKRFHLTAYRGG